MTAIHRQTPWRLVSAAATWHLTSQQHARRNALLASTALTERRTERLDVEEFLTANAARIDAREATAVASQHPA